MTELLQTETLILELLLIVSVVALAVRRFRIPYTVALVLAGVALSFRSPIRMNLTSELILFLLIPPLVFEAAFHLNLDKLRKNLWTIFVLAVPGVILTMLIVGGVVHYGGGLALGSALVFGALIAATDPVSVVAIFRRLGAPKRLEVMLEGESLFNDGTAIVLFQLALVALLTGEVSLIDGLFDFIIVAGGGVIVGLALGWVVSRLIGAIDDYLVETTLTTVLAFGTYLVAEQLHVSGVLAVVGAGLVNGNLASREMSPTTRIVVLNFWEYVAFLANSIVFLMIGLEIDIPGLIGNWGLILWAIGGVLISRAVGIYGLSRLGRAIPERWRHVMFWGGLRGAIALALALSLPGTFGADRQVVLVMTFGVVLFTLVGQGLSMEWLVRRLKLIERTEDEIEYERRHARALAVRASYKHLEGLHDDGLVSSHSWERIRRILGRRIEALTGAVKDVIEDAPDVEAEELETARREGLRAQRSSLANLVRDGVISDETYEELVAEVDVALEAGAAMWSSMIWERREVVPVRHLVAAVVQARDLESATSALAARGITATHMRSTGGFLRRPNHVLLLGVPDGKLSAAVESLRSVCRERFEFSPAPFGPNGASSQVRVGGATVFAFDVERYEELIP
ncbi:MAG TPA: Na+/H+ antiporter [Anaerolineales bacterium]|nr:Na+/H+ antiporter [Anaerolineales bacterium]